MTWIMIELGIALAWAQLYICFKAKKLIWKCLPAMVLGLVDTICWITSEALIRMEVSHVFQACAFYGGLWLIGLAIAWAVYGLIRLGQRLWRSAKER